MKNKTIKLLIPAMSVFLLTACSTTKAETDNEELKLEGVVEAEPVAEAAGAGLVEQMNAKDLVNKIKSIAPEERDNSQDEVSEEQIDRLLEFFNSMYDDTEAAKVVFDEEFHRFYIIPQNDYAKYLANTRDLYNSGVEPDSDFIEAYNDLFVEPAIEMSERLSYSVNKTYSDVSVKQTEYDKNPSDLYFSAREGEQIYNFVNE